MVELGQLESAVESQTADIDKLLRDVLGEKIATILDRPNRSSHKLDLKKPDDRERFVWNVVAVDRSCTDSSGASVALAQIIGSADLLKRCSVELAQVFSDRSESDRKAFLAFAIDKLRAGSVSGPEEVRSFLMHLAAYAKTLSPAQIIWSSEPVKADHYVDYGDGGWGPSTPNGALERMGKGRYGPELVNAFPAGLGWERIEKCLTLVYEESEEFQPMGYSEVCAYAEENGYEKDVARFIDERILQVTDARYKYILSKNKKPHRLSPMVKVPGVFPSEPKHLPEAAVAINEALAAEMQTWVFEGMAESSHTEWQRMISRLLEQGVDVNTGLKRAKELLGNLSIQTDLRAAFQSAEPALSEIEVFGEVGGDDIKYELGTVPLRVEKKKLNPKAGPFYSFPGRVEFLEQIILRLSRNPNLSNANFIEEIDALYGDLEGRKVLGHKRSCVPRGSEEVREYFEARGDSGLLMSNEASFVKCFDVWLYLKAHFSPDGWRNELKKIPNISVDGLGGLLKKTETVARRLFSFGFAPDYASALAQAWDQLISLAVWGDETFKTEKYVGDRAKLLADDVVDEMDPYLVFLTASSGVSAEELCAKAGSEITDAQREWLADGRFVERQQKWYALHRRRQRKTGDELFSGALDAALSDEAKLERVQATFRVALAEICSVVFKDTPAADKIRALLDGEDPERSEGFVAQTIKAALSSMPRIYELKRVLEEDCQPTEDEILGFSSQALTDMLGLPTKVLQSLNELVVNNLLDKIYGPIAVESRVETVGAEIGELLGEKP